VKAREFFESLEARADPSKLEGIDHTYLFDVDGEGTWLVEVRDGALRVTEGLGDADVTISLSGETFEALAARRQSPAIAYMRGKLRVKGDTAAALKLQKLF
jgi:predicted lipid carrier protein YhbT